MLILNIAGYKFLPITKTNELAELKTLLTSQCQTLGILGTILLSPEGINLSLAGSPENISAFKKFLKTDPRFADMEFHHTESDFVPFEFLNVKIKKEIITMRAADIHPEIKRAPSISPQEFKQWLDEGRDITVLDTRNDYEMRFGTFKNAINPQLDHFSKFTKITDKLDHQKPVVMFCTGGIRCEKAALHLLQNGFEHVYQLHNGILNYFKEVGGDHYQGECFVFDQRISVDPNLAVTGTQQCKVCQGPIKDSRDHICISMALPKDFEKI